MKVVFRTDASLKIGTGHVMRCLTLAKALAEKGAQVQFICRDHSGNLIERIRQEGFEVYTLTTMTGDYSEQIQDSFQNKLAHAEWLGVPQQQDATDCQPILERIKPDWLIVDHYAIDQAWQKALKPYYQKLMVIDDLGDRNHLCDLLLDQNYGSTDAKYQNRVPKHCKILAGAYYALLRPEFAQWREVSLKRREHLQTIKTILVTLGGVDPDNYTGQILTELAKAQLNIDTELVVVMGATAPHLASVKQQAETMPIKTTVKTNVTNMAELMTNADLAIGAAGATTWERCCLGLPTIQLVIAENQRQIAQALVKDNVVKLIDNVEQLPGLVETANQWIDNVSRHVAKVCDGLGCQRVVDQLLIMDAYMNIQTQNFGEMELLNFTELSEGDAQYVLMMRNHPEIKKWMYNQQDITETQHFSFIQALRHDGAKLYFLVKRQGVIIGVVYFTDIDYDNQSLSLGLYANRVEKQSKAGTILMEVVFPYIENTLKCKVINLEVFSSNEIAINLYTKFGFQVEAEKEVNGYFVYQMHKELGN